MEDIIFSLNATVPIFFMMCLGAFLHRIQWIDDIFADKLNSFVFKVALPALMFYQLGSTDFVASWDGKFIGFCFGVTLLSIMIVWGIACLLIHDRSKRGEFVQVAYRSSAAILGTAYIINIYGTTTMAPLMILGAVPLYNIMAVAVLMMTEPKHQKINASVLKQAIKGIITNPIIVGILIGIIWSVLKLPMGDILSKTVSNVGNLATPLGLMAMGASIDFKKMTGELGLSVWAAALKLFGLCAIFLPLAVYLGFRGEQLVAIVVMLGSASAVASFVMAKNMGHEGTLSSNTVALTTIMSSFSLTFWIYLIRAADLI